MFEEIAEVEHLQRQHEMSPLLVYLPPLLLELWMFEDMAVLQHIAWRRVEYNEGNVLSCLRTHGQSGALILEQVHHDGPSVCRCMCVTVPDDTILPMRSLNSRASSSNLVANIPNRTIAHTTDCTTASLIPAPQGPG